MNIIYRGFKKKLDSGPIEFLNYVKYAKLVISSSFHGNAFSIIFERPFLAIDGMCDGRVKNLITMSQLDNRSVGCIDDVKKIPNIFDIDFRHSKKAIRIEREKTHAYFKKALNIEQRKEEK